MIYHRDCVRADWIVIHFFEETESVAEHSWRISLMAFLLKHIPLAKPKIYVNIYA